MRFILFFISILSFSVAHSQPDFGVYKHKAFPRIVAQFNFTLTGYPNPVLDWVQVQGDPYSAIVTASDNRSGAAVSITTVGTGASLWNWNTVAAGGYVLEADANGTWPAAVGSGYFFNQSSAIIVAGNLHISGLVVGGIYKIEILSNRPTMTDNRLTNILCIDSIETAQIIANSAPSTTVINSFINQVANAGTIAIFSNRTPKSTGIIAISIMAHPSWTYGYVNAIKVTRTQ